jgi:hypothetical protein
MEPMSGIEPPTYGLRNRCSTTELHWPGSLPDSSHNMRRYKHIILCNR